MRIGPLALLCLLVAVPRPAIAYELKRTDAGEPIRWRVAALRLALHRSVTPALGSNEGFASLAAAAGAWTERGGPSLQMDPRMATHVHRPGLAGVQVVWPDRWEFAPGLLAVTATSYVEATGEIVDADILVNPDAELGFLEEGDTDRFDLGALITHETGHVLGLSESDVPGATMWPRIRRGERHQRQLAADDVEGLVAAYRGAPLVPPAGCGPASVAASGLSPAWLTPGLLIGLLLGLRGRRWAPAVIAGLLLAAGGQPLGPTAARAQRHAEAGVNGHALPLEAPVMVGRIRRARPARGPDGYVRTTLTVGLDEVVVPGGCVGGLCMRIGERLPPRVGETIAVGRRGASWERRPGSRAHGGWMAPPILDAR